MTTLYHAECNFAQCRNLFFVMLSVVMVSIVAPFHEHYLNT